MSTLFCLLLIAGLAAQDPAPEDWRAEFDRVYGLADGEALKLVPPPFIPERERFLNHGRPAPPPEIQPMTPTSIVVRWTDGVPAVGMSSWSDRDAGLTMATLIQHFVGLAPHEIEGPADELQREIKGDWSIRSAAKQAALLDALADAASRAGGRDIAFVPHKVDMDIVIARGVLHPSADLAAQIEAMGVGGMWEISFTIDGVEYIQLPDSDGMTRQLFDELRNMTGWAFLDEASHRYHRRMSFSGGEVSDEAELERIPRDQLDRVLESIAAQTGLEFTVDKREVTVWRLVTD